VVLLTDGDVAIDIVDATRGIARDIAYGAEQFTPMASKQRIVCRVAAVSSTEAMLVTSSSPERKVSGE